MKCFAAVLALVAAFAVNASAAEVKSSTLSKMGLTGMTSVSDDAGMAVRGKGFAASGGFSISHVPGTTAGNAAIAVSNTNNAQASTLDFSAAGTVVGGKCGTTFVVTGGISGGSASAK